MSDFTKTVIVDVDPNVSNPHTIQAGISALPTGQDGGTVIVESGTYTITSTVSIPSNVTLIGRGNVVLKYTNQTTPHYPIFKNSDITNGNSRICISGFKIIVATDGYNTHPVWLQNTSNCIVEKVYVTAKDEQGELVQIDNNSVGILIYATAADKCFNNTVRQCTVIDYGRMYSGIYYYGNGIGVISSPGASKFCKRNSIINNYTSKTIYGCTLSGAIESLVAGNVAINGMNWQNGDRSPGIISDYSDGSRFIGNQAQDNTSHGIYISNVSKCVVAGNVCRSNRDGLKINTGPASGASINAEYNILGGNVSADNAGDGILVGGQNNGIYRYNTVYGNVCTGNQTEGILEADATHASDNIIAGNLCNANTASSGYQIYTYGSGTQKYSNMGNTN